MSIIAYGVVPFIVLLGIALTINAREPLARERGWCAPVLVALIGVLLSYALSFATNTETLTGLSPIIVPAILAGILGELFAPKYWAGAFIVGAAASAGSLITSVVLGITGQQPRGDWAPIIPGNFLLLVVVPTLLAALITGVLRAYRGRRYTN